MHYMGKKRASFCFISQFGDVFRFYLCGWRWRSAKEADLEYLEMKPKFTVNLAERRKYLMVKVQLLIEGEEYIEKVKKHMPLLRHELIMLYSGLPVAELQTMEQREALRQKSKKVIREALNQYENSDGFRDVFFTEFIVN